MASLTTTKTQVDYSFKTDLISKMIKQVMQMLLYEYLYCSVTFSVLGYFDINIVKLHVSSTASCCCCFCK